MHRHRIADVPSLPPMTDEALREVAEEGRRTAKAYRERTAGMERLTGDDLAIRVR